MNTGIFTCKLLKEAVHDVHFTNSGHFIEQQNITLHWLLSEAYSDKLHPPRIRNLCMLKVL